jgi:hypothetical protein
MRIFSIATVAAAAITFGANLVGQVSASRQPADSTPIHNRILGYEDTQTGTFHPMRSVTPDAAIAPTTGKYEVTIEITLATPFPKSPTVGCSIDIEESSVNTTSYNELASYYESASGTATPTAKGYSCTLTIPYSWAIPASTKTNPIKTTISGSYGVSASAGTSATSGDSARGSGSSLPIPAALPKDGANTLITVDATL